ncbi:MAG: shikimate kinase [Candidatus Theseobacter exili]|nr:shikimate kinase [Candidatus Theseobacter exili]
MPEKSNIVLFGFMGTGKTEVSKILSKRFGKIIVEMDEWIEKQEGMSISMIFDSKGESYFRGKERELIEDLSNKEDLIISTGGGVVLNPGNIELLNQNGFCVCLKALPEEIFKRTCNESHRPLLEVENPLEKIKCILRDRKQYYDKIPYSILTDGLTVMEVVDCIADMYEEDARKNQVLM